MKETAYKGNIIFTAKKDDFEIYENSYILVRDGKVVSIQNDPFEGVEVKDYGDRLIIPAFTDLHIHAPQYPNLGLGYDEELLPWLNKYTFPTESKNQDIGYAKNIYKKFINKLWEYGSLRSVVFASCHKEATEMLFELFKESGLAAYVGKVNMDRNSIESLTEDTEDSIHNTLYFIEKYKNDSKVKPIITPRFVPSCTDELMEGLKEIIEKYKDIPIQSHLSENLSEIAWVLELHPDIGSYAEVYDKYKMLGTNKTVMAHMVYCTEKEKELLAKNGVYMAHCPTSNLNLMSGIAPVRNILNKGIQVGIGSDISGGHTFSIMSCMVAAIQVSKMYKVHVDANDKPLSLSEVFYMATKSGGSFFTKTGSFEKDFEFDALVIDDTSLDDGIQKSIKERLERFIYIGDDRNIEHRFLAGELIERPFKNI